MGMLGGQLIQAHLDQMRGLGDGSSPGLHRQLHRGAQVHRDTGVDAQFDRAGAIGVVLGILMILIGCPPYLPFLPILSEILSAELLIIAIVMVFRLVFEKKFKVENA